uniref:Fatty acyl-CoA reductase n=1 Tax=Strigamia maritima TaxID=126957 RepID=T1ITA3_STRMM
MMHLYRTNHLCTGAVWHCLLSGSGSECFTDRKMANGSSLSNFYSARSVFITGATGFMGKVLVEKLLRSCPDIKNIYVLIRSKNQMDTKCRVEKLLNSKVPLRSENPEALSKIISINGEISEPDFNLSIDNVKILTENVSVVFHFAASVRFTEPLKQSIRSNLMPINFLLQLCRKMHSLVALIHLSTAYSNCTKSFIDEIVYPAIVPPKTIIEIINNFSEVITEKISPILIGDHPNSYTFTKCLAETLIKQDHGNIPAAIVRPSIVSSSLHEPYAGWVDSFNHSSGFILAIATGLTRNIQCCVNNCVDLVPVDVCINLVIAAARETALQNGNEVKVYNCTTGGLNPLASRIYSKYLHETIYKNPFCQMIRAPLQTQTPTNNLTFSFFMMLDYITFIYPADLLLNLCQKKSQLKNQFNKFWKFNYILKTFLTKEWSFSNNNMMELWNSLSAEDRKIFLFDVKQIDWPIYIKNSVLGCKQYLLKESLDTVPSTKKFYR